MPLMLDEIYEQPSAVANAIERNITPVAALANALHEQGIRHIVIAARGTSDHAATYAKYLLEIVCKVPVTLAAPSVTTLYDAQVNLSGCLVLGISQSGQATDVVQTLSAARSSGALTACITNKEGSPLTEVSDHVMLCSAGEERSVAATKTYTTTLAIIALLAAQWSNDTGLREGLRTVPDAIQAALSLSEPIAETVQRYRYMEECAVLARGLNQATALESALKMIETSYLLAKAYSMADFLHGPIAMVSEGFPCLLYAPNGRAYPSMVELALKLKEKNAEIVVFARAEEIQEIATRAFAVPVDIDERLSPLLYIVPGQLWACHLAVARGHNPDKPRGLSKVTLTR
ncbi:MAG: SIS domain-containing protein [Chthonomonadaceae bacterium]|nr:SIS domain-containing protein [Chthonomonadaceae bacterium]